MPENPKSLDPGMNRIVGILLAAGRGTRFDPTGVKNKLLAPMANGDAVVQAAAKNLLAALPTVLAVVRPGVPELVSRLRALGCDVTECAAAEQGMANSLVHGLASMPDATGWIIALGDMPYVAPSTIAMLGEAIRKGADIAVPVHQGQRGNPVAFGSRHLPRLLQLQGDQGARSLLKLFPVVEIAVDDAGIVCDIDTESDLMQSI
jgi:molybdenum cofactor cytidylyltransferase